ncbi:hypothetical protein F5882DRAFT_17731 [Hyaloscypha sp. PMI_1271]|nr:hypothetical protein F5882DRAFT_17731 [Hyaloscypha sp. PMI_1271]
MFKTIGALKYIHDIELENRTKEGPQILHSFHQDIKPINILITSNSVASPYKWEFKVADLGLSHFKKVIDEQGIIIANNAHGTRTYGAPEYYRGDGFLEQANLKIKPNVNI